MSGASGEGPRAGLTIFLVGVALNYVWEMTQAVLYEPMGSALEASWRCFVASIGDGAMILGIFGAGWLFYRRSTWFERLSAARLGFTMLAGALVGVAAEFWGLSTERWAYDVRMPRIPGLELGLVPLVQMPILAPLTLWIAARWMNRRPRLQRRRRRPTNTRC